MLAFVLAAALTNTCPSENGLAGICGPVASEDLAQIPGTHWLIASGLNVGSPANLYLIDSRRKHSSVLFPRNNPRMRVQHAFRSVCSSPPQLSKLSIDGLSVRAASKGTPAMLFAANHGDRHAIEVFSIGTRGNPSLTWVGCVPMPKGTLANSVVALSDSQAWNRMDRGEATGGAWEWYKERGWNLLPTGGIAGANGLEVSVDERTLYVSAWASEELLIFDRAGGSKRVVPLGFRPDNIHRSMGEVLLVAGQRAAVRDIAACGPSCPQPWVVTRIDPKTQTITRLFSGDGSSTINYACGALEVEGTLFMTLRGAARIAWAVTPVGTRER
jgi:hypothetical protein